MKFSTSDFPLMRRSILTVCAAALVSTIILYSSTEYAESARNDRRNAQNMLNDARNRLATAHQDQENMAIYPTEYGALIEQKIIGDDQRLDWIEGLEKIRQKNLVADFRYSIAPQKIHAPQPPVDSGNFDIGYSEMKLQFDLLHEGQLLSFFDALRTGIKGKYQLDGCTLQRIGADSESGQTTATPLKADCSGGWITLKNRNAPK
ncbi:hypothetical protein [Candidatus Ferrigenium straubiae]|jgi:hypothetical protein|uniref:hypothetical protein n=1 Tax=Candidatus Ferrigenium straubiae TaxID=2919506 RepID=UPI003F4AAACB